VISPLLVSELLNRGKKVVVIMIGSTTCTKEVSNTISTIESYQSIAQVREKPVICYYVENGKTAMAHNDNMARTVILLLAAIWSGENHGLDKKDLENFLNYQNVTSYPVGITGLEICGSDSKPKSAKGQPVSTVITLISDKEQDHSPGIPVGYHSFGVFSEKSMARLNIGTPIHMYTVQGWFVPVLRELTTMKKEGEENYLVNPVDQVKISGQVHDDGLVI
jgi:hypothetical protein